MRSAKVAAVACATLLPLAVPTEGQYPVMTEQEAVQALSGSDLAAHDRAVWFALKLGQEAGPELRTALVRAALRELQRDSRRSDPGETALERMLNYAEALAPLRDTRAIPFFLEVIENGSMMLDALADIGAPALPGALKVVTDSRDEGNVSGGLRVLRFMVEDGWPGPPDLAAIREAAHGVLIVKWERDGSMAIKDAMFLAATLGDPDLLEIAATLASDRSAVEALIGGDDDSYREWSIETIQKHARGILSGTLTPLPKRRPRSEGG